MTREEKCKLAIERGFTYELETGLIYNKFGKIVNCTNNGYIIVCVKKDNKSNNLYGHQFGWYWVHKECVEQIDHINCIKNDNRISNLRPVNKQQNQWNRINQKGYSYFKRDNKWRARIVLNNKCVHLGYYNTEQEARNAYLAAKEIYHKIL